MTNEQRPYFAYLLRLWQVRTDGEVVWRASIEDPHTGERRGFADLDRLFKFLEGQTNEMSLVESQATSQTFDTRQIRSG